MRPNTSKWKFASLGAHAADVEREHRAQHVGRRLDVVVDDDRHHRPPPRSRRRLPRGRRRAKPSAQRVAVEPVVLRREEHRQPAVGDLGGERDVLRPLGAEVDRDVGAQRVDRRLQRLAQTGAAGVGQRVVARPSYVDRLLAGDHLADDLDVLAGAGQRLRVRLAVPALDDLRAGGAEAEHEAGRRRGGRGSSPPSPWRSGCGPTSGTMAVPSRMRRVLRAPPGQRREGVGAVGLGRPHRVEPERLRRRDLRRRRAAGRRPVAETEEQVLHEASPDLFGQNPCYVRVSDQTVG